jgi:hypothetical protein
MDFLVFTTKKSIQDSEMLKYVISLFSVGSYAYEKEMPFGLMIMLLN